MARQLCNLFSLLKVPDTVEVSMRQKDGRSVYFLLNHQPSPVRLHFYKPMHDFLTGNTFTGNYDLPSHGVLVLDEQIPVKGAEGEHRITESPVAPATRPEAPATRPEAEIAAV